MSLLHALEVCEVVLETFTLLYFCVYILLEACHDFHLSVAFTPT